MTIEKRFWMIFWYVMSNAGNAYGTMQISILKHQLVKEIAKRYRVFIKLRKLIHPAQVNIIFIKIIVYCVASCLTIRRHFRQCFLWCQYQATASRPWHIVIRPITTRDSIAHHQAVKIRPEKNQSQNQINNLVWQYGSFEILHESHYPKKLKYTQGSSFTNMV